jgi:hypothetical protein
MTTKGLTRHDGRGDWIRRLPEAIERANAAGRPVVVELPPNLSRAHQRLLASLGAFVKFKEPD